jgi:hypothetical protein
MFILKIYIRKRFDIVFDKKENYNYIFLDNPDSLQIKIISINEKKFKF